MNAGSGPVRFVLLAEPALELPGPARLVLQPLDAVLAAMVALQGPVPRDVASGRLWPEAGPDKAANNLRQRIRRLRRASGQRLFETTGGVLQLMPGVDVDLHDLAAIGEDELVRAELLPGCDFADNELLDAWLVEQRQVMRQARAEPLAARAEAHERAGRLAAALVVAEQVLALRPAHEHALRRVMRLHYQRGDHTAAIAAFEAFERGLREDTGARPGAETVQLLQTVERAAAQQPAAPRRLPPSLARPPVLVGREAEWAAMGRAWSGGRAFLLLGEAGLGKSRLLADLAGTSAPALAEAARAGDEHAAYALVARLLRGAWPLQARPASALLRRQLSRLLPELGEPPGGEPATELLHAGVEHVLAAAQAGGLRCILLDDLHLADIASLEALRWLAASPDLAELRWGLAARPDIGTAAGALLQRWCDDSRRPETIALRPLDAAALRALLASLHLPAFDDDALAERLFAHTAGHPLFTLETLKDAWLREGAVTPRELPRPTTVRALLDARLRALPDPARDLVRVAAVLADDLTIERAAALLAVPPLALAEPWSVLEAAQVLVGERFSHPLMLDAARALVPAVLQRSLHARAAQLLQADAQVPPARLAWHWQEAERWAEAGQAWHLAGTAARRAGRLHEQQQLLERAAACQRRAGRHAAEFAAVHEAMHGLQLRAGGAAVLAALPRLEALATDDDSRLRCALVQVEALLDLERADEARAAAARALPRASPGHPLRADALALQAMAEAQGGHHAAARQLGDAAVLAARAQGDKAQELRAQRSLAYVLYAAGALGDALPVQQRACELAAALGDEAERASANAAMGALLATSGDVPASHRHAQEAHRSYAEMGLAANSTVGTINLIVLGNAAAYLGRFDEALQHLLAAERMAASEAAVSARAKARISLAFVWLTLGQPAAAAALVTDLPAGTMVAMRMQAALILAQAAQMEGASGEAALARLGRLGAEHPDIPPTQGAWIEWSHQGAPVPALAKLAEVHAAFVAQGLAGTARAVRLRQIARWLDLAGAGDDQALQHAERAALELLPHVASGLHARSYPPAAWALLSRALERGGRADAAARSRAAARDWILHTALPHVPEAQRPCFLQRNPDNRVLLAATAGRARA